MTLTGRPVQIPAEFWVSILLSSLTGIVLGDFLLFATNAVFATFLGWLLAKLSV